MTGFLDWFVPLLCLLAAWIQTSSDLSTISTIGWGRMAFYRAVILYVCVVTYVRVLFSRLDKHHTMKDLYCRAAVGVWHSKTNFRWLTRPGSGIPFTRPPSPHLLTLRLYFPLCSALSSPVDIQRIVVPLFQFADHVTPFHNVLPQGDDG